MFIPTVTGVLPLAVMAGKGFGTLDAAGFDLESGGKGIELQPCDFSAIAYAGDLVTIQDGITVPVTAAILAGDHSWKVASAYAAGDTVMVWSQGDGVPSAVTLSAAPATSTGDGILVSAGDTGAIFGASETGPWILGR